MIDTDKYEGHTEGVWDLHSMGDGWTIGQLKKIDRTLMQDAPLLLEEVKRLHFLSVHYREVISRAIATLLSNPPEEMFESSSPTLTQDTGDLVGFYTQAMGHAIGILEGTE